LVVLQSVLSLVYTFLNKIDVQIVESACNMNPMIIDERVNNGLLRQIENLKSQVNSLQQKLNDVENVIAE
jgi:hypothetical protein